MSNPTSPLTHFHFDHVGSYLRTSTLKKARQDFAEKTISHDALIDIQHGEIASLVAKEQEVGLKAVTDGEFNRSWWHLDFLWGLNGVGTYDQDGSYLFHGAQTRTTNIEVTGKISANPNHPFLDDFRFLASVTTPGITPKTTIPSPTLFFRDHRSDRALEQYSSWQDYVDDLAQAYHDTVMLYYNLGARYIQFDDTTWGFLISQFEAAHAAGTTDAQWGKIAEDCVYVINKALYGLPSDLRVSTHICRGNFKSTYLFEGAYATISSYLGQLNFDTFFLEYDDERSGDFAPLDSIWNGRDNIFIVLGLITSKRPDLENPDVIRGRVNDATTHVPLENLGLSTQCGFASTEEGNILTQDEQWAKLAHIKSISDAIWG